MTIIIKNHLLWNVTNKERVLSLAEVIELYKTNSFTESQKIDFSQISYYATLKFLIYTPPEGVIKKSTSQVFIQDLFYKRYFINTIPIQQYYVINKTVLVFSDENYNSIKQLSTIINIGDVTFGALALLRNRNHDFLDYEEDETKCTDISINNNCDLFPEVKLYPYQKIGVDWLQTVTNEGVGCILADEMGLGKTLQIIYLTRLNKINIPSLIIAPNSLLENWRREILKFAPDLTTYIHKGPMRECYYKNLLEYNIILTSYDTAVNDFGVLGQIKWKYLILDEAQAIKNPNSLRFKTINDFDKYAGIAVTGTPFENHMMDVWALLHFCFPALLGSKKEFSTYFKDTHESASILEEIISPLILRRKVNDVKKDLPSKVIIPEVLEMGDFEKIMYDDIRQEMLKQGQKSNKYTIQLLSKLRQFCAFPDIMEDAGNDFHPENRSVKLLRLIEILEEVFEMGEKVLIFTHYIKAQNIIAEIIKRKFFTSPYILRGEIPTDKRQEMVDNFTEGSGFEVMILNPTVGGTGLNITAANHVIFYTLGWNPAQEQQCLARALRIGQDKTVFVHRLFYRDTVEEFINDKLNSKIELAKRTIIGINGSEKSDIIKALNKSPIGIK